CVIMDRLPFAPPDDPVHAAVVERMKRLGQNWFGDYVLPETAIRLKQGFGRLIRSKTDSGIVAILDPRLTAKGYGKTLLRSLPACQVVHSLEALSM
ncbi:MAG: helicase, partial [Cyanobacteria bacterium HKST-UBA05]|nr:helicase [Cyanobacteria bacterium HKST-UBA05]